MQTRPHPTGAFAAALLGTLLGLPVAILPGQQQFDALGKRHLPATGGGPTVVVDVDGDGDQDAVILDIVCRNDGEGVFTAAGRLPAMPPFVGDLAAGDVDGDGDADIVVAVGSGQQNLLYVNDGTGAFTAAAPARMPVALDSSNAAALDDVDRDGDLDIVFGNAPGLPANPQNRLYLNDGAGVFTDVTAARMPAIQDNTAAVVVVDVDGDGSGDIVVANNNEQTRLLLNDGGGFFADATATHVPQDTGAQAIAWADVDGDNDPDLVLARGQTPLQNRLYLNDGSGIFTDGTAARMPVDDDCTYAVALDDVDRDGDVDVVFGNYGQDRLYRNDGSGVFVDATATHLPDDQSGTGVLVFGDVDSDSDADLLLGDRLYLNDGGRRFVDATAGHVPSTEEYLLAAVLDDLDGDGDLDLVGGGGSRNRLYLNDGRGTFTDVTDARLPPDSGIAPVALGDVDGDGDLDLVAGGGPFSGSGTGQTRLLLNDGNATFTDATAARMPVDNDATASVVLEDVDADGDLDLVLGNTSWSSSGPGVQNRLYLNDGSGTFADATPGRMPPDTDRTAVVVLVDVEGDGDPDLVCGNVGHYWGQTGPDRLYLNDGSGFFTEATAGRLPAVSFGTTAMVSADVDGDGDFDLFATGSDYAFYQPLSEQLYLNDGSGAFTDVTASRLPGTAGGGPAAAGDVDGDGDQDFVLGGDPKALYLNDGNGFFSDASSPRMPARRSSSEYFAACALGDVDGDADLDIVWGGQRSLVLDFNLQRQLDAPLLMRSGRTYTLEVYARYGPPSVADVAVPFISTGTALIPLPPLGTLGLDPTQMLALPVFVIPQPAGVGSVSLSVPNLPGLVGVTIYSQALLMQDPYARRLTNVAADVIL